MGEPRQLQGDQARSELHCLASGCGTTGESEHLAVKSERWVDDVDRSPRVQRGFPAFRAAFIHNYLTLSSSHTYALY